MIALNRVSAGHKRYRHNGRAGTDAMLYKFLFPYLFFLLLPTLFSYIAYFEASRNVRAGIIDTQRVQLERVSENTKQALGKINELAFSLSSSPDIARFFRVTDYLEEENFRLMRRVQQSLSPFQITNNLIFDYYVHFNRSNVIMSPQTLSFRLPLFYRGTLTYEELEYEDWFSRFFDRYHTAYIRPPEAVNYDGKTRLLMSYLQSIPMDYAGIYSGTVLVLLRADEFAQLLDPLLSVGSGWAYVLGPEDTLLTWAGFDPGNGVPYYPDTDDSPFGSTRIEYNRERYVVSYLQSPGQDWTYVAGAPRELLESRVIYIRRFSVAISLAVIVVGGMLAVAGAYRISKPFRAIIDAIRIRFGDEYDSSDPLREIESAVGRLVRTNEELRSKILQQEPFVAAALFERIILGEVTDKSETFSLLSMIGVDPGREGFRCLLVHIHGWTGPIPPTRLQELNASRVLTKEIAGDCFRDLIFCHETSLDRITLLLGSASASNTDAVESDAVRFGRKLWTSCGIKITITGGDAVNEIHHLSESYTQARIALETMSGDAAIPILWYSSNRTLDTNYHYPLELENMFMSSVRSGNTEKALQVLTAIIEENFEKRSLSPATIRSLQTEIQGSFQKLLTNVKADTAARNEIFEKIESLSGIENRTDFITAVRSLIHALCSSAEHAKRSHNSDLAKKIEEYVDSRISDPALGLQRVAEYFGLCEVYFSQFFKEQIGENFTSYVTRRRTAMAKEILERNPGRPVKSVATEVGYQNADTFRKAYKRIYGTNPTSHKRVL